MSNLLLWVAIALYGAGIVMAFPAVMRGRPSLSKPPLLALGGGLLFHASSLAAWGVEMRRFPVADIRSALSFFSFLITLAFFFAYLRYRNASVGIFMLPLAFLLTLISGLRPERSFHSPVFRSGWLWVHILTSFLGYAGFSLTFAAAVMYLIQERELKSKRPRAFYYRLPSLEICEQLYYRSLVFGFPFLSLGLLTGFVGASREWRGPWEFDPKILASLITWLVYLILFSAFLSGSWRGRRAAYVAIFGFAIMMVTFLGVTFLSGQHGYFPKLGGHP